jgi:hypothetical protein
MSRIGADEHPTKELLGTSRPKNGADVKYTGIRETIERRTDHLAVQDEQPYGGSSVTCIARQQTNKRMQQ